MKTCIALALITQSLIAQAIMPDYQVAPSEFPNVGYTEYFDGSLWKINGTGSVIGDNWVVTAKHNFGFNGNATLRFRLPSWPEGVYVYPTNRYFMDTWVYNNYGDVPWAASAVNGFDVAFVQFAPNSFSGTYDQFVTSQPIVGATVLLVGAGYTAIRNSNFAGSFDTQDGTEGTLRRAYNKVSEISTSPGPLFVNSFLTDFDGEYNSEPPPGSSQDPETIYVDYFADGGALPFEGSVQGGDSGGPTYVLEGFT